jgi:hypothetical protein
MARIMSHLALVLGVGIIHAAAITALDIGHLKRGG